MGVASDASAISAFSPLLVAVLPALLSPIVAWVLSRSKVSKEAAIIDYLNKRLDVLERLNKLHTQFTEGPIRPFLDTEIEHCRAFLRQPPTFIARGAALAPGAPQSRWARFFLTQPAVSVRQRVFKGLFYLFFGTAILILPMIPLVYLSAPPLHDLPILVQLLSTLLGFGFYLVIALLFRRAAR
jgi:hypothetical protein